MTNKDDERYLKYSAICILYGKTEEAIESINLINEKTESQKVFKERLESQRSQQEKKRKAFKMISRLWSIYSPATKLQLEE